MKSPKVSVLMSVYNGEKYLREAIDSILNQTFEDFEFIIINDASTDKTLEILHSYHDQRIILIDNEYNIGLTKSLNKGINIARGEYIARMDADDISLPERLEKQVEFLKNHSEFVLLGTSIYEIDESGKVLGTLSMPSSHDRIIAHLLFRNCFIHSSTMFNAIAVKRLGGYDESITYAQDHDMWWRLSREGKLNNLPELLHLWRKDYKHGISFVKKNEQENFAYKIRIRAISEFIGVSLESAAKEGDIYRLLQKRLRYIDQNSQKRFIKEQLLGFFLNRGYMFFNKGDNKQARYNFIYSLQCGNLRIKLIYLIILTFINPDIAKIIRKLKKRLYL